MSKKKTTKKKSVNIDEIDRDLAITPDQAAARSQAYMFAGKKLEAFSQQRQVAADSMDVKLCTPAFPQIAERLQKTNSYPGMWADAQKVLWLCSQPIHVAKRAVIDPETAINASMNWGEKNKVTIGCQRYGELMETFGSMIADIYAVSAETESDGGSGGKNQSLGE